MAATDYDLALEELERRSTERLLCADVYDAEAFAKLHGYISSKAQELNQEFVLPKQLLKAIRTAAEAVRSRAEYVQDARNNISIANDFDMLLDLLIASENPADRQPGVPRIL